jgi:hypothetical protein
MINELLVMINCITILDQLKYLLTKLSISLIDQVFIQSFMKIYLLRS